MENKKEMKVNPLRRALLLGSVIGATTLLTGCPVLFVGGVATGAAVALDRRTAGTQLEDATIKLHVLQAISNEISDAHINVNCYNRRVLLTGEVATAAQREQAEAIASKVENVVEVYNALAIGPNTSLGSRSQDTYITGKVKAALTSVEGVSSADIKVITERQVVYLMGILTAREAELASKAAATVSDVRKVVLVVEIISDQELQKINSSIQSSSAPSTDYSADN